LELFDQRLVDAALCAVGESRCFGGRDGHGTAGSMPSSRSPTLRESTGGISGEELRARAHDAYARLFDGHE
jgi:hypothetical protein